jgi:hypothetical protein
MLTMLQRIVVYGPVTVDSSALGIHVSVIITIIHFVLLVSIALVIIVFLVVLHLGMHTIQLLEHVTGPVTVDSSALGIHVSVITIKQLVSVV